ncbi:hypothetical protein FRC10_004131 [Ceratobasidium sp. 414]|nr:hypothetical protein FRC10_004131 [Ceratobasidium sp. 414]
MEPTPGQNTPFKVSFYQRKALLQAFSASSRALLDRASQWSSRPGREGLHIIKFDTGWRSPECTVEKWYQSQLGRSQEQQSTTRFTAIQHRRTSNAPFFHEFLLIPLVDGSYYRAERTGVGVNAHAFVPSGCTACDLIEWFPRDKYEEFTRDKPSTLIVEVQFPTEFDILDVLAVCYSIQQNKRARRYTLMCFNCYFFCCATLSLLTRRVANWECTFTPEQLGGLPRRILNHISNLVSSPSKPGAKKYVALRLCAMLDPESSQPAQRILDDLTAKLMAPRADLSMINTRLQDTCWWLSSDTSTRAFSSMLTWFEGSALPASDPQFHRVSPTDEPPLTIVDRQNLIEVVYAEETLVTFAKYITDARKQFLPLVSRSRLQTLMVPALSIAMFRGFVAGNSVQRLGTKIIIASGVLGSVLYLARERPKKRFLNQPIVILDSVTESRIASLASGWRLHVPLTIGILDDASPKIGRASHDLANAILDRLESLGISNTANAEEVRQILSRNGSWERSWQYSVVSLLSDSVQSVFEAEAEAHADTTTAVFQTESGPLTLNRVTVFDFQAGIRAHIKAYADRVHGNSLESSTIIRKDVEEVISELWISMPDGFGKRLAQPLP